MSLHANTYRNPTVTRMIARTLRELDKAARLADTTGDPRARSIYEHAGQLALLQPKVEAAE